MLLQSLTTIHAGSFISIVYQYPFGNVGVDVRALMALSCILLHTVNIKYMNSILKRKIRNEKVVSRGSPMWGMSVTIEVARTEVIRTDISGATPVATSTVTLIPHMNTADSNRCWITTASGEKSGYRISTNHMKYFMQSTPVLNPALSMCAKLRRTSIRWLLPVREWCPDLKGLRISVRSRFIKYF